MNRLISTRGVDGEDSSLKNAILSSQPLDGGLYVFDHLPQFSADELRAMEDMTYSQLAKTILGKFDFGIPNDQLAAIIDDAYGEQWDTEEITPMYELAKNQYVLELWHGPTQAFKDVALQFLPRILSAHRQEGQTLRALGASSGDTISAAHFGVGDVEGLQSVFLLPQKGPSEIQRLQATAHGFKNATTILIDGNFDAGQKIIKRMLVEPEHRDLKEENNFTSFNSINIARILAQIVYYFRAYLDLVKKGGVDQGNPINFSVPTGNFGDALAGIYAKDMGLPVGKINMATNANDVLHRLIESSVYEPPSDTVDTRAPSQDITKASNFERMIFRVINDPARVVALMKELDESGKFTLEPSEINQIRRELTASRTSDYEIDRTIQGTYARTTYLIDPHTATGINGGQKAFGKFPDEAPTVYLSTAEHIKFQMPEGVPVDRDRYDRVVSPLRRNPEDFIIAKATEQDVIRAVREAVDKIDSRI